MRIIASDLDLAVQKGIINSDQAKQLVLHFEGMRPDQSKFQGLHVLYYIGGVLILASMSWFLTTAWESGVAITAISGLFALMYLIVGHGLWNKEDLKIPGGLLVTAAVGLTPVFVYGLQKATGFWPLGEPGAYGDYHIWVKGSWLFMEVATIIAAAIALRFFHFPFLTFPLAFTLWYMSMDLTPLIFGRDDFGWEDRETVSLVFGLIVLIGSYFVDRKIKEKDFAFWTYLYGMLAFWGSLSMMDSGSELGKLFYCALNIGFFFFAVYLRRRVFLVFGTLGVLGYIGHLAWTLFKDSYAFPIALAFLGLLIVYLGIKYQKNKTSFEAYIEKLLPTFLMKWRPDERA
jgi:hypothetical protein